MKRWEGDYFKKTVTAGEAIGTIQSGERVVTGHVAGEPHILMKELVGQKERLTNIEIVHMVPLYGCEYTEAENKKHFRHNSLFVGAGTRTAINEGRGEFTPCFFSEIPRLFRDNYLPVDKALIQLTPPDEHGFMSFGVSVDYTLQAAVSAKAVIAEVNPQMPRTHGSFIHIDEVDLIVEVDYSIVEIPLPIISTVEERIGKHVASLVPDRANLQLGIGAIPDAALKFLNDKKDLGIHSEMFSDGVVDLYERGMVTNAYNNLNPGKFVASFLMGTKRLYNFVHDNPIVLMKPVDYTNNIRVAGMIDRLISINSALEVDLYGQVAADMIGGKQFSAVGGQVDFVRAASSSFEGKSIIAFPSSGKRGTVSRIVPHLSEGACVTTSRSDIQYIVTEFGIAELRGKNNRQRAEALINIAHPKFRGWLEENIH
ncbi:MAG: acetyl-CoA hydrolase/transferase family protein [Spirochaetales bacterium]|jgi:4-hydroxybutyrate CoA-transferase|nr:acetyl-CoA hydrolase/transferase family protein [Spirochaetales bacterium]